MNILRAILIGLASFVFIVAVTGYVYLFTLQTTVMDRTVVKTWLNESQLYDGRIISALVQATSAGGGQNGAPQPAAGTINPSPEAIETALNAAFPAEFTQAQIEGVVDNAYDWIDGTKSEFTFSIPIDQKRDTLIAQLAKAIEPQVAALPVCQASQGSTCRPPNMTVEQLANQLTTDSINESGAFAEPITNKSFSSASNNASQEPSQTTLTQLPAIREGMNTLLVALPVAAIISLAVIIVATARGWRMARTARLSRRVFFGMLFIFLPTALVIWLAKDNDFGLSSIFTAQTGELVIPLIKTIGIGILTELALITGIIGAIGAATWITLGILGRNKPQPIPNTGPPPAAIQQAPITTMQSPQQSTPLALADTPQMPQRQPIDSERPPTNYQR